MTAYLQSGLKLPLIAPQPPMLSRYSHDLAEIEAAGIYSNYGPMNTALEEEFIQNVFQVGSCLTVCNATIGLMLAIREVIGETRGSERCYALMPSFTFAAAAHAAIWCGLTPLFCDIDPETWLPDAKHEEQLLAEYAGQVAVVVPYATFGNNLDLCRYARLSAQHTVPIVVDAAASLGSLDSLGQSFGAGFPWAVVFSMHATKAFSVGEGGLVYCADKDRIERLRAMGSFGFVSKDRAACIPGLNSKMSEVAALTARLQLREYPWKLAYRQRLAERYQEELGGSFQLQAQTGMRQARSFMPALLPAHLRHQRTEIIHELSLRSIGAGSYFSPHLAEQPYFQAHTQAGSLEVTADIASRIVSLPLTANMSVEDVKEIADALKNVTSQDTPVVEHSVRSHVLHSSALGSLSGHQPQAA